MACICSVDGETGLFLIEERIMYHTALCLLCASVLEVMRPLRVAVSQKALAEFHS